MLDTEAKREEIKNEIVYQNRLIKECEEKLESEENWWDEYTNAISIKEDKVSFVENLVFHLIPLTLLCVFFDPALCTETAMKIAFGVLTSLAAAVVGYADVRNLKKRKWLHKKGWDVVPLEALKKQKEASLIKIDSLAYEKNMKRAYVDFCEKLLASDNIVEELKKNEYSDFTKKMLLAEFDEYLEECGKVSTIYHGIDEFYIEKIKSKQKTYIQKQL